jgi:NTE family protein
MLKHLVLSGGSMKGLAYLGAIKYLEENDLISSIETFCGTSVGSCVVFYLLLGYNFTELYDVFYNLDINKARNVTPENILNFCDEYGLDKGENVVKIQRVFLRKKLGVNDITFKELFNRTNKSLVITGSCLNTMSVEYFDYKKTPNMSVIEAIRISLSIPFFFTPIVHNGKYYVDGAVTNNYPIEQFPNNNSQTLGLLLTSSTFNYHEINNLENYIIGIINTNFVNQDKIKLEKYYDITIELSVECNSFDFSVSTQTKQDLIEQGYIKTKEQIMNKFSHLLEKVPRLMIKELFEATK